MVKPHRIQSQSEFKHIQYTEMPLVILVPNIILPRTHLRLNVSYGGITTPQRNNYRSDNLLPHA